MSRLVSIYVGCLLSATYVFALRRPGAPAPRSAGATRILCHYLSHSLSFSLILSHSLSFSFILSHSLSLSVTLSHYLSFLFKLFHSRIYIYIYMCMHTFIYVHMNMHTHLDAGADHSVCCHEALSQALVPWSRCCNPRPFALPVGDAPT